MDAINGIGSALSKVASNPLAKIGTGIAGTVGNITGNQMKDRALLQQLDLQKSLAAMTPQQLALQAQQLQQPLSEGLTQGVGNQVQAMMGERGLSQAPGIFSQTMAQSLAPFQIQEQQMAMNAILQKLGLPIEAAGRFLPTPNTTSTAGIWQTLMNQLQGGKGTPNIGGNAALAAGDYSNLGAPSFNSNEIPGTSTGDTGTGQNFNFMDFLSSMGGMQGLSAPGVA